MNDQVKIERGRLDVRRLNDCRITSSTAGRGGAQVGESYFGALPSFCDLATMPFEEAVGRLRAFEERVRKHGPAMASSADGAGDGQLLFTYAEWQARQKREGGGSSSGTKGSSFALVEGNSRGRGVRGRGRGRGRGGRGGLPRREGVRDKSNIKCFNCDKMGHYASECKTPKKQDEAHLTQTEDTEPALLLAVSEKVLLNEDNLKPKLLETDENLTASNDWYLDNGASNHMTGDMAKFCELDEGITGRVKFGDGSMVQIMGKGSILFACHAKMEINGFSKKYTTFQGFAATL